MPGPKCLAPNGGPCMAGAGTDWLRLAAVGHVPTLQTVANCSKSGPDFTTTQPGPTISGCGLAWTNNLCSGHKWPALCGTLFEASSPRGQIFVPAWPAPCSQPLVASPFLWPAICGQAFAASHLRPAICGHCGKPFMGSHLWPAWPTICGSWANDLWPGRSAFA
jgi:hypothetical protein